MITYSRVTKFLNEIDKRPLLQYTDNTDQNDYWKNPTYKKRSNFNPDREYINQAIEQYLANGGSITLITEVIDEDCCLSNG